MLLMYGPSDSLLRRSIPVGASVIFALKVLLLTISCIGAECLNQESSQLPLSTDMSGNHDLGHAHRPCKYCIYLLPPLTSLSSSAVFLPLHISEIQLFSSPKRSSNSLAWRVHNEYYIHTTT